MKSSIFCGPPVGPARGSVITAPLRFRCSRLPKGETIMGKTKVRGWALGALTAVVLLGAVPICWAVVVSPGGYVALHGTTAADRPDLPGVVQQDDLIPFTIYDYAGNPVFR